MTSRRSKSVHINLPADLQLFVEEEFATGRYSSPEEVLIQSLQWLREERRQAVAGIRKGLADATTGRVQPLTGAMAEIRGDVGADQGPPESPGRGR